MKVTVDMVRCESHGQCVFAAPEVFTFDDDDVLTYHPEPSAESRDRVRTAAEMCPVGAITLT